jgi:hypothetical protein
MPDFSVILQHPEVRAVVQENALERAFHDGLFPAALFRGEATPVPWPSGVGDTQIFSAPGLIPIDMTPRVPGTDPIPKTYPMEQWSAQLQQYDGTIDTHMPTSINAIVNLFLRNTKQLGLMAGQTLNRLARNRLFNAALSGWTVADGAQGPTTTLRVKRLNGFTRARNPNVSGASKVRFDFVSSTNPLSVRIFDTAGPAEVTRNVIGFTPDIAGDEVGPGTVTLSAAVTVLDGAYVKSFDATNIVRSGGGNSVRDLTATTDIPTLANIRTAVANFWKDNVPAHPDSRFHVHLDPTSQALLFADAEFQRLMTSLPDYFSYREFALGELLNCVYFRNSENPTPDTVLSGTSATFDIADPFPGELYNTGLSSGTPVHRILFTGQGGIMEYYSDLNALITDAGLTGKVAEPRITNNGIEVNTDRVQFIIRAPLNRTQDQVASTWKFIGDWPFRTDAATGSVARYKRASCIEHCE